METLGEKFHHFFQQVENCQDISVVEITAPTFSYTNEQIQQTVSMLKELHDFDIAKEFWETVMIPSELSLQWGHHLDGEFEVAGGFRLFNIFEAISMNQLQTFNQDLNNDTSLLYQRARYFDNQPDGIAAVLFVDEDDIFFRVWIHDEGHFEKLDISYLEYLDKVFLTKGMFYWQYLFCDEEVYKNITYYKKQYIEKMLRVLRIFFPDEDYSDLNTRYQKRLRYY